MITSIERKVSIKKESRLFEEKVKLVSRYGFYSEDIIKTIDNKVIDLVNNKVIYKGNNVTLDIKNKIILDNVFEDIYNVYKVYDIDGNYLFEGRNVSVLGDNLFSKCVDKVGLFGTLSNKKVLCDSAGEIISDKLYDNLHEESCKRIITVKNKRYGEIDRIGNTIVKPVYSMIDNYNDGIAIIKDYDGYSLINTYGCFVTEERYDLIVKTKVKGIYLAKKNNKYGYINHLGEVIIPLMYDYVGDYSDLITVANNDKYGFINNENKLVVDTIYDNVYGFKEGYAWVMKNDDSKENGYREYVIDKDGNIVSEIKESIACRNNYGDNKLISATKVSGEDTKLGYVDIFGDTVIPFIYEEARVFKDNLAVVKLNDKYGAIDENNNVIIDFKYDSIGIFNNGYAITWNRTSKKYGLINNKGDVILPEVFDNIILLSNDKVYVEEYIYDIKEIKLDYKIIIKDDDRIIIKNFNNEKEMNDYYFLFTDEYINFMEKLDLHKKRKLTKEK